MGRFIRLISLITMLLVALDASAQERVKVSGTVTDKYDGTPVIGTTVTWGNGKGTTTDLEGNYSITVDAGDTIRFLYLGYFTREWRVPSGAAEVTYNVELEVESTIADEVVVVAYGTRQKGTIAGSVSTVKSEKL